jgi:hypothetical protein
MVICSGRRLRFAATQRRLITDLIAGGLLTVATLVIAGLLTHALPGIADGELRTLGA